MPPDDTGQQDAWKRPIKKQTFSRNASSGKFEPKNPTTGKTERNPPTGKTVPPRSPGTGQTKKSGDDKGKTK